MDELQAALVALNKAAYDAIRAGQDTTAYPDLNRQALRRIAREFARAAFAAPKPHRNY
jgi:hypothetical protein